MTTSSRAACLNGQHSLADASNSRAIYVTGTDTGIGKTFVSVALLHALQGQGLSACGMKPLASGCVRGAAGWVNDDALALQAASSAAPAYARINPFALTAPTAPEIAARLDGVEVELGPIISAYRSLHEEFDRVVVEGVGGWLAPLSDRFMQADLVAELRLPVLLVVGLKLGCINHALLTARAIAADGAMLIGWVANRIDEQLAYPQETLGILQRRLSVPWLGTLPHGADPPTAAAALRIGAGRWSGCGP